jgi:carboxylate-amine ligase
MVCDDNASTSVTVVYVRIETMARKTPSFTLGIEEDLLVDKATRDVVRDPPEAFFYDCEKALGSQVSREFLKPQIEIATRVAKTPREAGADLRQLRATIIDLAEGYGLAPIAASTHPFTRWSDHEPTERDRYQTIARDLAGIRRRLVICGMHVHVGLEDDELRIDLMNQARYFLPHLLMLSTSSPFREGDDTGLKCHRLAAYDELPRTGLPDRFMGRDEYRRTVDVLVKAGIIEDATKIWWDIRPSARYPTLEMRVTDVCTRLEDAVCVAALYACLSRMLYRMRRSNQIGRQYPAFLLAENRWRSPQACAQFFRIISVSIAIWISSDTSGMTRVRPQSLR